ncbi:MAG: hypothetical protein KGH63_00840 [Candidatus Micrarchaeota archaeon]|nr:hypothetical protein [Candidatus Micrarchaeota archaeon]
MKRTLLALALVFASALAILLLGAPAARAQAVVGNISVVDSTNPQSVPIIANGTGAGAGPDGGAGYSSGGAGGYSSGSGPYSYETGSGPCPTADRLIQLAAVVGNEEGGLMDLDVSVAPGNGSIFSTIFPTVGVSTQQSEQEAVAEAFSNLSVRPEDCDVAFALENDGPDGTGSVDGPSAGVAMTVALRAALTGKALRPDVVITGAILPGGKVGPVGGLIDKAQAASRDGKRLFLTPHQELYESIVMASLARQYNFSAIEVHSLGEAFAIATSAPGTPYASNFTPQNRPVPANLTPRAQAPDDVRLGQVANAINDELARKVQAGATGPLAPYQAYFQKEMEQNRMLAGEGYAYTSANNAFLAEVDADFLTTPSHALDVSAPAAAVRGCLSAFRPAQPTDLNFEWVAGANARAAWARQKLEDISNASALLQSSEEKYAAVRELYYAQSWCEAAGYMTQEAQLIGGKPVDAQALMAQARTDFARANATLSNSAYPDSDAAWHLGIANASLARGDPLAAIYDAAYAAGAQKAADEVSDPAGESLENATAQLASQPMATFWGRTYQSQGVFTRLQSLQDGSDGSEALRVLRLAAAEDDALGRAGAAVQPSGGVSVQVSPPGTGPDGAQRAVDIVLALAMLGGAGALALQLAGKARAAKKR